MMYEPRTFRLGEHATISEEYSEPSLQGQTGLIVGLPIKDHYNEYLIELDGGLSKNPMISGRMAWIANKYLRPAKPSISNMVP